MLTHIQTHDNKTLGEILAANAERKESTLTFLLESITHMLDKAHVNHSIVHRLLLDYLTNANTTQINALIEQIKEQVVEMYVYSFMCSSILAAFVVLLLMLRLVADATLHCQGYSHDLFSIISCTAVILRLMCFDCLCC
jgi:hypothetical protein